MSSSTRKTLGVLLTPQILHMLAKVYVPVLFPLTFLVVLLGFAMDRWLGFPAQMLEPPLNWVVGGVVFAVGGIVWVVAYAAIVFEGRGSPSPTAGRTQQLVTTGIYGLCRYPSVHAKFLGVMGVGVALNSFTFTFLLCPLLLMGSLAEKLWRQEPQNHAVFGDEWLRYRERVPFFIPWRLIVPHRRRSS
jgi:protein-S-isoprenylcysteine O-methyltransferase Ste14